MLVLTVYLFVPMARNLEDRLPGHVQLAREVVPNPLD